MNLRKSIFAFLVPVILVFAAGTGYSQQLLAGSQTPMFSLKSVDGNIYSLAEMKDNPMMIIYFFDASSRPSQESLLSLDKMAKKYQDADLKVWGVTRSPKESVEKFMKSSQPGFPILLDDSGVSDQYQARTILPTTCILGPDLKLLDLFQGGGTTTNVMLVKLAERKLQQKETVLAKAISDEVVKNDPRNTRARMIKGYAALKAGQIDEAEKTFTAMSKEKGDGEIIGKEGLAGIYAMKGENSKALELASSVEKAAPGRAYIHTVKGDVLYAQNKKDLAQAEYAKAVEKPEAESFQMAGAYNKLGRLYASVGSYEQSRDLYDQAVQVDPYYVEAMANKGVAYEKEGQWDKALDMYRQGQKIDGEDIFSNALAKRAAEMLALKDDSRSRERVDKLVKELAERYRSNKALFAKTPQDTWTSQPMVMTFIDFQETGSLSERDGLVPVLTTQLADELNASGRVKVVERVVIERLLEELNIGSSELADPQTSLRLGRVLAAKVIGTGSLIHSPEGTLLSLRLVDTETTAIPKVINRELNSGSSLKKELHRLNREILTTVMTTYPLQGYIINVTDEKAMVNLGADQGVVMGSRFTVIEEPEPIKYKGKTLRQAHKKIADLEVIQVDPDLSYCRILSTERQIVRDDKTIETINDQITGDQG
ncbi:MAG TPA: tetratricopeptide repeat protein [Deltaproteobacteria bacterium]|nr:tetratricopeptide repeat protein [Deltaproteobacteria bacterium]